MYVLTNKGFNSSTEIVIELGKYIILYPIIS